MPVSTKLLRGVTPESFPLSKDELGGPVPFETMIFSKKKDARRFRRSPDFRVMFGEPADKPVLGEQGRIAWALLEGIIFPICHIRGEWRRFEAYRPHLPPA
jgi:hypothetical protein